MSVVWAGGEIIRQAGIIDVTKEQIEDAILGVWNVCVDNKDRTEMDISALHCVAQFIASQADNVLLWDEESEQSFGSSFHKSKNWSKTLASPSGEDLINSRRPKIARIDVKNGQMVEISVESGALRKCLESSSYVASQMKKQWRDRGWLKTQDAKRFTRRVNLSPVHRPSCVVFNIEACNLLELYGEAEQNERKRASAGKSENKDFENARRNLDVDFMSDEENEETLGFY